MLGWRARSFGSQASPALPIQSRVVEPIEIRAAWTPEPAC